MKKCNNKIKANKYAFGAKEITDGLSAVGNIAQGFNSGNQTAQSVFSGLDSIGNFASSINPIAGMAVKGVAGVGKAITSIVGTKGSVDQVTGEITEGTGILGRKNRSKLRQQSGIVKNNIAAAQNSARYAADWYSENGYNEPTMVADGGVIPNTLAYLDDGEFYRTPDGEVGSIPDKGRPAGSDMNLVNAPIGTQVFSEKLKNPDTGNSFAQDAKKINKKYKLNSKKTDKYGQTTQELNQLNGHKELNELMNKQEEFKRKRNIRKNKIANYDIGTPGMVPEPTVMKEKKNTYPNYYAVFNTNYNPNITHSRDLAKQSWYDSSNPDAYRKAAIAVKDLLSNKDNYNKAYNDLYQLPQIKKQTDKGISFIDAVTKNIQDGLYGQVHDYFSINYTPYDATKAVDRTPSRLTVPIGDKLNMKINKSKIRPAVNQNNNQNTNDYTGIMDDILSLTGGLISPIQNITAKRGETNVPYTYTPKYGPTNWNISPMLNEINRTNSISRYNMSNINPNTGANMAYGIQSAIARDNAIAQAYSEKLNKEALMAAQNADIYNRWAQFDTTTRHTAAVENAQDRAALDNVRRTGWRDLSTALQTMSKDRRLSKKDKALLEAMKPYLDYGMTSEQLNNLYNLLG